MGFPTLGTCQTARLCLQPLGRARQPSSAPKPIGANATMRAPTALPPLKSPLGAAEGSQDLLLGSSPSQEVFAIGVV